MRTGHFPRPSPLSSESAGLYSYRGLLNLGMLIVFFTNFHEIVRNFKKYGLIFSPLSTLETIYEDPYSWPSLSLFCILQVFVAITFLLEKMVAAVYSSDHAGSPKSSLPLPNKGALVEEEEEEDDGRSRRHVDPLSLVADTDTELERMQGLRHRQAASLKHVAALKDSLEKCSEEDEGEEQGPERECQGGGSKRKKLLKGRAASKGTLKEEGSVEVVHGESRSHKQHRTACRAGKGSGAADSGHKILEVLVSIGHVLNFVALLVIPVVFIWHFEPHPMFSACNLGLTCIYFFKCVSYWMVNREHRLADVSEGDTARKCRMAMAGLQQYPNNVRILDFLYFLCAPTLVYDLNYPRSRSIRKMYIVRRLLELFITVSIMIIIAEQYMVPLVRNAIGAFLEVDVISIVERTLKLAVPNLYFWLCGFYAFFHVWLSVVAELLRFADREFYRDWWNATTIDYFWRNWNIPVHKWMLRHLYFPLRRKGYSRAFVGIFIFFISGVFHEYMVSVPFHTLKLWAFLGMFAQVPLAIGTRILTKGSSVGNVMFWLSIMLGQPLCILLYSVDYASRHAATAEVGTPL